MGTNKKTAVLVGVLYIIGTVAGSLGTIFASPIRNAQDSLISVAANGNHIILGALFVLVMGLALAMVPVTAFPVLRKHNQVLALGYVVFRGGLETVGYMAMAVSWLLLLPLSQVYQARTLGAPNLQALGDLLLEVKEIFYAGTIVFALGAMMFYSILYQSKLIPRWLSGWGLIAAVSYLATCLLGMFGLVEFSFIGSSTSTLQSVVNLSLAVQEMVMAVWLIAKGFNPSAIASGSAKVDMN